jgi:hypothetical protein
MILGGIAWKLLAARKRRNAGKADPSVVDAEYRVVRKAALPHSTGA